jgi:AcrR family transcriptional regulator
MNGSTPMGVRERKKAATRESLIDAAARLFNEHGVEGTTMDDVAREAGTSRTSVFNYFGYKEALLVEIGARYVQQIAEVVAPQHPGTARGILLGLADAVADLALDQPVLATAVAREMTHPEPGRRQYAMERMGYPVLYRGLLMSLAADGRLRNPDRMPSYERQLVDLTSGTLVRMGGDFAPDRLRTELHHNVDLFCDGALIE